MDSFTDLRETMTPEVINTEGIVNPTYDHWEDMTGYELASPEFLPTTCITPEVDVYANHSPQYANQIALASTKTNCSGQQTTDNLNEGRQLKETGNAYEVGMGYSSCNDIPLTQENINSIAAIQLNRNHAVEYEKGGYVQPIEVFNPMGGEESECVDNRSGLHGVPGAHSGTKRKEVKIQEIADAGNNDLQHDENGYISPTDAPANCDLGDPMSMATSTCENPYTGTPKARRKEFQRFDSGVVDCDPGGDISSQTLTVPIPFRNRLSTSLEEHYEDIDVYRNEKRKPSTKRSAAKEKKTDSMKVRILPRTTSQRPRVDREQTSPKNQAAAEPVSENPTPKHRRAISTSPNPYSPADMNTPLVESDKKKQGRGRQCCILSTILLALFLLVTVSLAISISMLLMHVYKTEDQNLLIERSDSPTYRINMTGQDVQENLDNSNLFFELQSQLHSLKLENVALQETIQKQMNETQAKFDDIVAHQKNMSSRVGSLSSQFDNKLDNISSKLQEQDLETFASCSLKSATFTKLNSGIYVETTFKPDKKELEGNFVLFAFCTFIGMEDVNIDLQKITSGVQYRCRCKASKKGHAYKSCTLYYWLCPRK